MYACNCRGIKDKDVQDYLNKNPHMLSKTWAIVSKEISGKPPVCNNGKGACTESATDLMSLCAPAAASPA